MTEINSQPKSYAKKAKRVSARKELAVVTLAAVASIAGVGGLLSVHQPVSQMVQPTPHIAAASWSSSPHGSHSTVSQGSKAIAHTGRPTNATRGSALVSRTFGRDAQEGEES
jgi:predicted component of type VI protein secretion system